MKLEFVNRDRELLELESAAKRGGLLVVYGRRRVGKTRLVRHWLNIRGGLYSQAIEAQSDLQLRQVFDDLKGHLETEITPKTWAELLELLSLQQRPWVLCIDEFPYLTAVDPSLPSRLQKWLDHSMPSGALLILAGSSTRMMNDLFLNRSAPLYGRASKLLQVRPMDYPAFCRACGQDLADPASFEKFACVGGIPKYWEFVDPGGDVVDFVEDLYFDFAPYMENEPLRLLRDEGVGGLNALAVLEAIGRGAHRPSEIALRLNTAQTNLSRLFQQLMDASILTRELPYGESVRSTRKILYQIEDPAMRFWFGVFSPHQSRWASYPPEQKHRLIHEHASWVFEAYCRSRYPGAARYWERDLEIDMVAPDPDNPSRLMAAEVKFKKLTAGESKAILDRLKSKWAASSMAKRHPAPRFEVFDTRVFN
ncbi:MAG: ATP-binding protein [Pseudomonadota bacterium]